MASFTSATSTLTAEGTILDVVDALAVKVAAAETDSTHTVQVILLPNGLFQGIFTEAVL